MKNYNQHQIKKWKIIKIISIIVYFLIAGSVFIIFHINWLAAILFTLSILFVLLSDIASTKEANYKKGEAGELLVEEELKSIPGVFSYRDLMIGEETPWNLDFVLVSENRVLVLEVKNYEGRITADNDVWYQFINGKRRNIGSFSKQARGNAVKLREYLISKNPEVSFPYFTPIVVLTKPYDKADIRNIETQVISPDEIRSMVLNGKKLDAKQKELIVTELDKLGDRL